MKGLRNHEKEENIIFHYKLIFFQRKMEDTIKKEDREK